MAITWTDVTNVAPELSTVSGGRQTAILALSLSMMNTITWGVKKDGGQALLAAHIATLENRAGVGGPVTEQHAGTVGQTFGMLLKNNPYYSTSYGMLYLSLLETIPAARYVIA